ncbi:xylulokinase [Arthrobacter pigmenti]|uniref:Xylulokinase n=1 Tax=Arthrobacter pigmenti TaxID=271432 RepID=A0A846REH4_9MICC|nr:FGGY family carbohydrate kinase [Arthrobacter pigmenti]NJC21538.1 xylulokinase [Arthrobacter pigmenti]
MTSGLLIGIDVGTSSVKVVATDTCGQRIADCSVRYPTATDGAGAEQDARSWWAAVARAATTVIGSSPVTAVAVTSQAPTLVPIDADGTPTAPALTWLDRRAVNEANRIADVVPESRNGPDPFFGTAKLPWLASHRSSAMDKTTHVLSANGFIVQQLTGVAVLDDTTASLMQGFNDQETSFDERLLKAEPSMRYLPRIVPSSAVVGWVTAEAARVTGIPVGTPVVAGGIDSVGSALEAGTLEVGDPLVDMTGFSSVTILAVPRGTYVPGFIHSRHCVPDVDLLITAQVTAGATVDWINNLDTTRDLRDDDAILSRDRPGRLTMVPSLAGERTPSWNQSARGIIDGIDLAIDGTDLMLAAMEGNALALAQDVAALRDHGFAVDRAISTGGGASSRAWLAIKSDVLGIPIVRPASGHGAAQGAAALAGLAVGVYGSTDVLRQLAGAVEASYQPDPALTKKYAERLPRYTQLTGMNSSRSQSHGVSDPFSSLA